jgi:hypothetical protein
MELVSYNLLKLGRFGPHIVCNSRTELYRMEEGREFDFPGSEFDNYQMLKTERVTWHTLTFVKQMEFHVCFVSFLVELPFLYLFAYIWSPLP